MVSAVFENEASKQSLIRPYAVMANLQIDLGRTPSVNGNFRPEALPIYRIDERGRGTQ